MKLSLHLHPSLGFASLGYTNKLFVAESADPPRT